MATTSEGNAAGVLLLGSGDTGVVLAPESDGDICQWLPFARELRDQYRVALFDWEVPSREMPRLAVEALRDGGAGDVVLGGASLGGTFAMAEAHTIRPPPAGILSLGGPTSIRQVDARPGIRRWMGPMLLLGSEQDRWFDQSEARVVRRLHPGPERVLIVPGAAHGVDLLDDPAQEQVRRAIDTFLERVLG